MANHANYKQCRASCIEECEDIAYTTWYTIIPLELNEVCQEGTKMHVHFEQYFANHFAFESYKSLVEDRTIPDIASSYANGSLCKSYVQNYISFISVESPTTSVIKSIREKKLSFNDQLGTVGGTLGLFTGMSLLSMVEVFFFIFMFFKGLTQECLQRLGLSESQNTDDNPQQTESTQCQQEDKSEARKCCHNEIKIDRYIEQTKNHKEQIKNLYVSNPK